MLSMKRLTTIAALYIGDCLNHVYPVYPIPEARMAIEEVCRIIKI